MGSSTTIQKPRINNQIRASELRVIGAKGENLGVMSRDEALALSNPEAGLDLIEIAPQANPPVARLMSFDKYRYELEKTEKKERQAQKAASQTKQIQISARSGLNDLLVRLKKLEEFLADGNQVEIQLKLRGREKGNKDWARQKMNDFLGMITTDYKIISPPRFGGRGMITQVARK